MTGRCDSRGCGFMTRVAVTSNRSKIFFCTPFYALRVEKKENNSKERNKDERGGKK